MNIPEEMLEAGETILWSHIVETPASAEMRKDNIVAKRVFRIIALTAFAVSAIFSSQAFMGYQNVGLDAAPVQFAMQIAIISAVVAIGTSLLSRSEWVKNLYDSAERPVFQNGFVTDKRVVFFNHFNSAGALYRAADIKRAVIDFENGGYALKIVPTIGLPSVLVGGTDFRKAKAIIDDHLL